MENASVVETTGTELSADIIVGEDQPSSQGAPGKSLFGEVAPSEAELMGEEPQAQEKAKPPADAEKPIEGYVPLMQRFTKSAPGGRSWPSKSGACKKRLPGLSKSLN